MRKGSTIYSRKVEGDAANYHNACTFDLTDGYLGITEVQPGRKTIERVLLSPKQVDALIDWLRKRRRAP